MLKCLGVRRRVWEVVVYTVVTVTVLLFIGKMVYLPIVFIVVGGKSMEPTLRIGDLAIGLAVYVRKFGVGDIVLWCIDLLRLRCTLHRVVEIKNSEVITKGDFNPAPDPPIPINIVYYVVVAYVPSYIWIPLLILVLLWVSWFSKARRLR